MVCLRRSGLLGLPRVRISPLPNRMAFFIAGVLLVETGMDGEAGELCMLAYARRKSSSEKQICGCLPPCGDGLPPLVQGQQVDFRRAVEAQGERAGAQAFGDQIFVSGGNVPGVGIGLGMVRTGFKP